MQIELEVLTRSPYLLQDVRLTSRSMIVSPDENSESQVAGICEAIKQSGCDGVIVGNTTKRRPGPLPAGYTLPEREAALMLEQGGYSGPELFERTVALVKRYRTILDEDDSSASTTIPFSSPSSERENPPGSSSAARPRDAPTIPDTEIASQIQATTERDAANLKPSTPSEDVSSKSQPLLRLPERNSPSSSAPSASLVHPATPPDRPPALSSSSHINQISRSPPRSSPSRTSTSLPSNPTPAAPKSGKKITIFATGGITNGKEALEVLEAGASVAMVYTALVYGGVGTISRIKQEMREEMRKRHSGEKR